MIFTLGNILTFVVLLGVILVFRQLDSKNRSLEKVKKFSDIIKKELDEYFDKRSTALRDASLDLEAKQTKAIATVKRLDSQRAAFAESDVAISEKLDALTKIETRIKAYDETIEQLMDMTERADENLRRISSESARLAKAEKKVTDFNEKLQDLSTRIPQLTDEFSKQNYQQMQDFGNTFISNFQQKVVDLESRFDSNNDRTADLLGELESSIQSAFEAAAIKAKDIEDSAFSTLHTDITDRFEKLRTQYETTLRRVQDEFEKQIEQSLSIRSETFEQVQLDIKTETDYIRQQLEAKVEDFKDTIQTHLSKVEQDSTQMQSLIEQNSELADRFEQNIQTRFMQVEYDADQRFSSLEEKHVERSEKLIEKWENYVQEIDQQMNLSRNEIVDEVVKEKEHIYTDAQKQYETFKNELDSRYDSMVSELNTSMSELVQTIEKQISDLTGNSEETTSTVLAKLQADSEHFAKIANDFELNATSFEDKVESRFSSLEQNNNASFEQLQARFTEKLAHVSDMVETGSSQLADSIETRLTAFDGKNKESVELTQTKIDAKLAEISTRLDTYSADIEEKISQSYLAASGSIEKLQQGAFGEIEKHFDAYKSEMLYRFERIEKTASDIDLLDAHLHEAVEQTKANVLSNFEGFTKDQEKRNELYEQSVSDKSKKIEQYMQSIEKELNELKSRAYDNVSEKLNVFEEDFFADLNKRSDIINSSFIQWRADIESQLTALAANSEDERRAVEVRYTDELKNYYVVLNNNMRDQVSRLEEALKKSEQDSLQRIVSTEGTVSEYIEEARNALTRAKKSSEEFLQREMDNYNSDVQEQFKKRQEEIAAHIEELALSTATARDNANVTIESVRDDLSLWLERVNQQFEESKNDFGDKIEHLKSTSQNMLSHVAESFKADTENYAQTTREERSKVIAELDTLRQSMDQTLKTFEQRSEDTVKEFNASYETMLEETQRRIREQNVEASEKLRSLKDMAQEINEKNEEARQKMVIKMQTDSNNLQMAMDTIDERLKSFTAQTQLFERADSLKKHLEEQIAALRNDTSVIDSYRQSAAEIEEQFAKIRRLDEELAQKLSRVLADKKQIEAIEADFTNLMTLSENIDQKVTELKSSGDDLQRIQLEIRRFQENVTEVSARYDRLEKKQDILDRTISDVDKTFESLTELENRIDTCTHQTDAIPNRLLEINGAIDRILENSGSINDAVAKLDSLEGVLSEASTKMDSLMKSREWLAQTETRLEEINRQAQSQVKIFGDLMKKGGVQKDEGAPPLSVRDTAIKLAHQGWKVDEIARATGLSRGEVELILELGTGD